MVFPVCHYDNHFVNFSPENQYFTCEQKEKSVHNFKHFMIYCIILIRLETVNHEINCIKLNKYICILSVSMVVLCEFSIPKRQALQ